MKKKPEIKKTSFDRFMKFVGGKRGLAIIAGLVITAGAQLGWIPSDVAVKLGDLAAGIGVAGIVHANIKNDTP